MDWHYVRGGNAVSCLVSSGPDPTRPRSDEASLAGVRRAWEAFTHTHRPHPAAPSAPPRLLPVVRCLRLSSPYVDDQCVASNSSPSKVPDRFNDGAHSSPSNNQNQNQNRQSHVDKEEEYSPVRHRSGCSLDLIAIWIPKKNYEIWPTPLFFFPASLIRPPKLHTCYRRHELASRKHPRREGGIQ
ncbi:hypothetical protein VTG60DRAFT_3140 [Thermothelomyces hinnuleus]